jgi:hypothetical protein
VPTLAAERHRTEETLNVDHAVTLTYHEVSKLIATQRDGIVRSFRPPGRRAGD